MHRFLDGLVIIRQTRQMVQATLISLFLWLSYGFAFYLVSVSLNIDLPWYAAFVVAATIGLAEAIPSTAGYVGTFEFFAVAALAAFSIERSTALASAFNRSCSAIHYCGIDGFDFLFLAESAVLRFEVTTSTTFIS